MSLHVYLTIKGSTQNKPVYVPVRENGTTIDLSFEEYVAKYDREPVAMIEERETDEVFSANITHNLGKMARQANLYEPLWRPEEISVESAHQLIPLLAAGYIELITNPERYKQFNPENGWGSYDIFVQFVSNYLKACIDYPDAAVSVDR